MNRRPRLSATLARSLARETLAYGALGFGAAVPVLLLPNLFRRADVLLAPGITPPELASALGWSALLVAVYALPVSFLFGLLLALGRISGDAEVRAMRACGVGAPTLVAAAVAVGAGLTAVALLVSVGLENRAWRELASLRMRAAARGAVLETGRFHRFGPRTFHARERLADDRLGGVVVSDGSDRERPLLLFAESARVVHDEEAGALRLELENGDLRMRPGPSTADAGYRIAFARLDYTFTSERLGTRWALRPAQLSLPQLLAAQRRAERGEPLPGLFYEAARFYEIQLHRLLAIPATPLLFACVGAPLGLLGLVRSRARGALLAIGLFAAYYALFMACYEAARAGDLAPFALWLPNAGLVVLAGGLSVALGRSVR